MQSKRATSIHICARRNLLTILILCSRMGCDTNRRKDKNNRVLFQSYVAHTGHFVLVMSRKAISCNFNLIQSFQICIFLLHR